MSSEHDRDRLSSLVQQRDEAVEHLLRSRSWRLAAPLRSAAAAWRRMRGLPAEAGGPRAGAERDRGADAVRIPLAGLRWASAAGKPAGGGREVRWLERLSIGGEARGALEQPPGCSVSYRLTLPRGARFRAWVGLVPDSWQEVHGGVEFTLSLSAPDGRELRRWSAEVPSLYAQADRWHPFAARLGGLRSREVVLTLETRLTPHTPPGWASAAWGDAAITAPARSTRNGSRPPRREDSPPPPATEPDRSSSPLISVITPVHDPDPALLDRALASVLAQTYASWELCVYDDGSRDPLVARVLEAYRALDERVSVERRPESGGISSATNAAIAMAAGDYVALLDHDDELGPEALAAVAGALAANPSADVLYTDEGWALEDSPQVLEFCKPDWSPEFLEGTMYTNHLTVYRRSTLESIGPFRGEFDGSQDYDAMLRAGERTERIVHVPGTHYTWRVHASSAGSGAKPFAYDAAQRALEDHYARCGIDARCTMPSRGFYRAEHRIKPGSSVAVVLPVEPPRAGGDLDEAALRRCVEGLERSSHEDWTLILVAAGNAAAELSQRETDRLGDGRGSVVEAPPGRSRAELLDLGADSAGATYLLLLGEPCEPLDADWLEAMIGFAARDPIGAVGAQVLGPDGRIERGGVVIGSGMPLPAYPDVDPDAPLELSQFGRVVPRNYSAAAGAVMTRRELHRRLGGLARSSFDQLGEVDYCLRLRQEGLRIVITPFARLRRCSTSSPYDAIDVEELVRFSLEWGSEVSPDPYYNPSLWQDRATFRSGHGATAPRLRMRHPSHAAAPDTPKGGAADTGDGSGRAELAARYVSGRGLEIGALHKPVPLPEGAHALYVDRLPVILLRDDYPEFADAPIVEVDRVDDGERLAAFADASQDFVIANHFLEHCEDPIGALENVIRVLRPGGVVMMAVPDKRYTFDLERPVTDIEHIVRDHEEGPERSRRSHYEEWAQFVEQVPAEQLESRAVELEERRFSVHTHVWTQAELLRFLLYCRDRLDEQFDIEALHKHGLELLVVLRRAGESAPPVQPNST